MRYLPLLLGMLLLPQDDPAEKAYAQLQKLMDAGHYQQGRVLADQIAKTFPKHAVAAKSKPYVAENAYLRVVPLDTNGPPANRIDVVIMADGVEYDDRKQAAWDKDGDALVRTLLTIEPFKEYAKYFNLYRANVASRDAKLNKVDQPVVTFFKTREDENGDLISDGFAARDVAKQTGADEGLALVHVRPGPPGHALSGHGVAIFGSPKPAPGALLHAWGHAFAGLGDEGVTGGGGWGFGGRRKEPPPIPTCPNVADTGDATAVPWSHWMLAKRAADKRAARIEVMEGAAYRSKGAWRPYADGDCIMSGGGDFCPVCREALILMIYTYVRLIDGSTPFERPVALKSGEARDLNVAVLNPATHTLKIEWVLERLKPGDKMEKGDDAKSRPDYDKVKMQEGLRCGDGAIGPRRGEGPKWKPPMGEALTATSKKDGDRMKETVTIDSKVLGVGKYRVTAIVRDLTEWVIKDAENLLCDYRSWLVTIDP